MANFIGGAVPLHRQLKGLLLPGLPRGQIQPGEVEGGECYLPLFPFGPPSPSPSSTLADLLRRSRIQLLRVRESLSAARW